MLEVAEITKWIGMNGGGGTQNTRAHKHAFGVNNQTYGNTGYKSTQTHSGEGANICLEQVPADLTNRDLVLSGLLCVGPVLLILTLQHIHTTGLHLLLE